MIEECTYTSREIALAGCRRIARLHVEAKCDELRALNNRMDIRPEMAAELRQIAKALMNLAGFIDEVSK
jgi:hypothetical protein